MCLRQLASLWQRRYSARSLSDNATARRKPLSRV